jgi:hypothetical protein
MSLESKNYVATSADIAAIARAYSEALDASTNVRGHYFRALVATTQSELGAKPRQRSSEPEATLDADGISAQLSALETVHERFYATVLETVSGNAEERNRRSGFARSAVSTVRAYVRAGFDITLVAAARITKAAMAAVLPPTKRPRVASPPVLQRRADRALAMVYKIGDQLGKADKALAVEVLEGAIAKLAGKLAALGVAKPVTDAKRAVRERVPLKTRAGTFYPVGGAAHA